VAGAFVGETVRFRFIATWPSTASCPTLSQVTTALAGGPFRA
jgi:hypothetical protein